MSANTVSTSIRLKGFKALPEFTDDPKQQKKFFEKLRKLVEAGTYWNTEVNGEKSPGADYDPAQNETIVLLRAGVEPQGLMGKNSREWDIEIITLIENAPVIVLADEGFDYNDYGGQRQYYAIEGRY